jgi:O-antigen ligase
MLSIEENPWGIGWGGFGRLSSVSNFVGGDGGYPHNMFLEAFVEGGLVAGTALALFVLYVLVRIRRISGDVTGSILFALAIYC